MKCNKGKYIGLKAYIQFSHSVVSDSPRPYGLQPARLPCPSPTPGVHSTMSIESVMPSNHLIVCHPLLLPSIFPASGSFQMSHFFAAGSQSIGVSASASVLPMNIQDRFPLGWMDHLAVQGTLKSLLLHHSSKASILRC